MPDAIEKETVRKMENSLGVLRREMAGIRTGRASAGILDPIKVDCYGTLMPVKQMATVSVPESRVVAIQPWDISTIPAIEKAIQTSDIGITPANDGKVIRLVMPLLSGERRKEIAKMAKKLGEEGKVTIRNIRRESMEQAKKKLKAKEMSEDDERKIEASIQKLTDEFVAKIGSVVTSKEKEILED